MYVVKVGVKCVLKCVEMCVPRGCKCVYYVIAHASAVGRSPSNGLSYDGERAEKLEKMGADCVEDDNVCTSKNVCGL